MAITITITKTRLLFIVFGLLANLGLAFHQYIMFVRAFLSPQKAIILYINVFGEANSEMVLLTISLIIGFIVTAYILIFLNGLRKGEGGEIVTCDYN
jgi:hypothetical protein